MLIKISFLFQATKVSFILAVDSNLDSLILAQIVIFGILRYGIRISLRESTFRLGIERNLSTILLEPLKSLMLTSFSAMNLITASSSQPRIHREEIRGIWRLWQSSWLKIWCWDTREITIQKIACGKILIIEHTTYFWRWNSNPPKFQIMHHVDT